MKHGENGTVSKELIYREAREGRIPNVRVANRIIFDTNELDEWWNRKRMEGTQQKAPDIKYGGLHRISE